MREVKFDISYTTGTERLGPFRVCDGKGLAAPLGWNVPRIIDQIYTTLHKIETITEQEVYERSNGTNRL